LTYLDHAVWQLIGTLDFIVFTVCVQEFEAHLVE
jgi:hypothetical protein